MLEISTTLLEKLKTTSEFLIKNFEVIPEQRKRLLEELSIYIKGRLISHSEVSLTFICTHNSRRSHMAQIWAKAAAHYYGIPNIHTFSGGTQKTAFNPNAVNALKSDGFKIKVIKEGKNPNYKVSFDKKADALICFSKVFNHRSNPQDGFVAVMTCSDADESCPIVRGAEYRTTLKYDDPKAFDNTEQVEEGYLERSHQIGTEMFYVFSKLSEQ